MHIKILTLGTRGDVQPFVALALELKKHGYDVTICTGENFQAFVEEKGVSFLPISVDYLNLTQSEEGKKMMSGNPIEIMKNMKTLIYPMMERMLDDLWERAKDAEVLIYSPKAFGGYDIAEKLGIPVFLAHPIPIIAPTGLFTNPALPFSVTNPWFNKKSFVLNRMAVGSYMKILNKWRAEKLGLPTKRGMFTNELALHGEEIPVLYGCSPSVIPYDTEWGDHVAMYGFWFLEEKQEWEPTDELMQFMEKGTPPIAISFSSMPLRDPQKILNMITEALEITGQRGLMITGWSGIQAMGHHEHMFHIPEIPHTWLFPRTTGVIHHGGAGTTAVALQAGKPMLICPFSADQPFWASRMKQIGVSTPPLTEKEMSTEAFVDRIRMLVHDTQLSENARNIATQIKQEKGLEKTVEFITKKLQRVAQR